MANPEHLEIYRKGPMEWNKWRNETDIIPDLSKTILHEMPINKYNLSGANLSESDFGTKSLYECNLVGANLSGAFLAFADLTWSNLSYTNLREAYLHRAILTETNLTGADLTGAQLTSAICIQTDFSQAIIENVLVFGISVWNIKTEGSKQKNLIITQHDEPSITVDNIEVAQFIYLILNNQKIRDVIGTIAKKGVLILGRFTPERKQILDAIRGKLREYGLVPIMFDFDKAQERDFTETVKILAGMSRFVIADITNPRCAPLELQATVPDYQIPFAVIKQKDEQPFSMFVDLQAKYNWVLPIMNYSSEEELLAGFKRGILDKVLEVEKTLLEKKLIIRPFEDDIGNYRG